MTIDPSSRPSPLASKLATSMSPGFAPLSQTLPPQSDDDAAPAELQHIIDQVRGARAGRTALLIRGGGSKDFFGESQNPLPDGRVGQFLDIRPLAGITSYEPTELVVTARAGTPLAELEAALAEKGQHLPFDPPHFGPGTTVGGMVAAGLSGPARAAVGGVRDYVLGAKLLNGKGELVGFGGTVMKNVAGYDVARVLAGSMGTLGVICEVSLKVLPVPPATVTLRFEMEEAHALEQLNRWAGEPLPIDASVYWKGTMALRLRGARSAVDAAVRTLGGEIIDAHFAQSFWRGLRDQTDDYFASAKRAVLAGTPLWRLSLPQTAPPMMLEGDTMIEWGGAQRWLSSPMKATELREAVRARGGHATLFRSIDKSPGVHAPLQPPLDRIHRSMKRAFDPAGLFNPGRLYKQL